MKCSILIKLKMLKKKYKEIEIMLSEKNVIKNQKKFQMLSREYLQLSNIMTCFFKWEKIQSNIDSLRLLLEDPEMRTMAEEELQSTILNQRLLEKELKILLLPEDPDDKRNCFMELKAATGGNEAAIFTGDLFKMYYRYAELRQWKIEVISSTQGDQGGFKEIVIKIVGNGVCGKLKFESGGHRVQRVPKTESQGRIHTSTCVVAVMPELPQTEQTYIQSNDLKIDTFRSSGAGGQHVNTTDSAIRITHIPTGHVVECQDERSQHKNKAKALSILASRIYSDKLKKQHEKNALLKKCLLGSGARSDRNRTYNFPKNRITDHRINLTLYRLDEILNGKLDILINPIIQEYQISLLSNITN